MSERLALLVEAERAADGADRVTHADWRAAHDRLLETAFALSAVDEATSRIRAEVLRWADPYAADAAGVEFLDAVVAACGPEQGDVRSAALDAIRAGRARDRAEAVRAATVASRVEATRAWRDAAEALLALAPVPDPTVLALLEPADEGAALDGWFTE